MSTQTRPLRARPETLRPRTLAIAEAELDRPTPLTVLKLLYNAVVRLFHDPIGMLLGSAFLVLMLWGPHGNLELLHLVWPGWQGPGSDPALRTQILPGIPWDQEWLSFWAGTLIVVGVPALLIRRVYGQSLRDYGLGLPPRDRLGLAALSSVLLLVICLPAFWLGAHDPGMRATYPFYHDLHDWGRFAIYEIGYFPFFLTIEFIFRGYLLFGLYQARDSDALPGVEGVRGPLVFGYYAILISMLSYTAWHLGKPVPELWGTIVWGIAAGTVALAIRSIWPIILVHWLLNVFLDAAILHHW